MNNMSRSGHTELTEEKVDRILEGTGIDCDPDDKVYDTQRRDSYTTDDDKTLFGEKRYGSDELRMMIHNEMREALETIGANHEDFPKVCAEFAPERPGAYTPLGRVPKETLAKKSLGDDFERAAVQRLLEGDGLYTTGKEEARYVGREDIRREFAYLIDEFTPGTDDDGSVTELRENYNRTIMQ
ncbi:MAG: hypothetical protein J07AB43_14630 [Candidatus Nanosalina sp. J07AB43]|jgi:hypothetical protein|nr:MAG: hypothetical protein J07AB43_14630 [Candidatus Nanosalina sp. J07AB43]